MIVVGKTDAFERKYMEKFRLMASDFGEFVKYENLKGARDIGIHLTHSLSSGKERVSTALVWFQMNRIMVSTMPLSEFEKAEEVSISLDVNHLRYWYLQPMPTYLAIYIESVIIFKGLDNFRVGFLSEEQVLSQRDLPPSSVMKSEFRFLAV